MIIRPYGIHNRLKRITGLKEIDDKQYAELMGREYNEPGQTPVMVIVFGAVEQYSVDVERDSDLARHYRMQTIPVTLITSPQSTSQRLITGLVQEKRIALALLQAREWIGN